MIGFQALVTANCGVRVRVGLLARVRAAVVGQTGYFRYASLRVSHLDYVLNGYDEERLKQLFACGTTRRLINQKARI